MNTFLLRRCLAAAIMAIAATGISYAQQSEFSFGPPLRSAYLFAYKYTERVTAVHEIDGAVADSSERVVSYYITEHQTVEPGGSITLTANIDSMQLDFRGANDRVSFNTQRFVEQDWKNARHIEVLAPSSLVNRIVSARISPYGEILEMKSGDLDAVRKQTEHPGVEEFTRVRVAESLTNEYISSILFPWRMAPLGRKVRYEKPTAVPFWVAMDRLSFHGTGNATLGQSPSGEPVLRLQGKVEKPVMSQMTIGAYSDPLKVKSAQAVVAGELTLEEDGVVRSGWINVTGSVVSDRNGAKVTSHIRHETYIEQMAISPYAAN